MITASGSWFEGASRRSRWLVAVSGGADSVALLHFLVEQGFTKLIVCHLDHRLRGRASTEDAQFVKRLAAKLGMTCEIGREDVTRRMATQGESMETSARNARHGFFAACARKHHCSQVLLAHHRDDQAETVLWNLLRGSHGLKGMLDRQVMRVGGRRLTLHRPLLEVSAHDLREWLTARRLSWREDASNSEMLVTRNRLRHAVLPLLDEISGRNASQMITRALAGSRELMEVESWAVAKAGAMDPQGRLHLPVLRTLPSALQRSVITAFLKQAGVGGIDRALVSRIAGMLDPAAPPAVNLPGGGFIRRRAGRLVLEGPS